MSYIIPKGFNQVSGNLYAVGNIPESVMQKAKVASAAINRVTDAPVLISRQPLALASDELEMWQLDLLSNSQCLVSNRGRKPSKGKKLNTFSSLNGGRLGVSVYTVINRMAADKTIVTNA